MSARGQRPASGEGAQARENEPGRVGLWLVGARGAIATCVAYGLAGLRHGLLEPRGLATEAEPLRDLDLVPCAGLVLGGHEVCQRRLSDSAAELVRGGVLSADLVAAASPDAAAFDARIRPGVLDGPEVGQADLMPEAARLGAAPPLEQIARMADDLRSFRDEQRLQRVVVVNLASTEAWRDERPEWSDARAFEAALQRGDPQPVSIVYARAAFEAGCPFVNFTPNRGSSVPALRQIARERGLPHCGNDGKTGETLLKTVLGPMFRARGLRVLSWQGYNMLGNRDGEALALPARRIAKLRNKDEALRQLLADDGVHTHVAIDFVRSLGDWKTALDFVHFEGFLGAKMTLQFTWCGSDSALAAPLIVDLVRLADFAAKRGEVGEMAHTACYFKSPLVSATHDFHAQHAALLEYARARLPGRGPRA